jgi:hypothetical protein
MTSRLLPYSTRPARFVAQLFSDFVVLSWTAVWVLVGIAVYDAISAIVAAGRQVEGGTHGIADSLASAGHGAQHIPLVGDAVSKPLSSAGQAALDITGALHNLNDTASWLAVLLALAVVAVPILLVALPWLLLRLQFFRRKWVVTGLAATPAGERLLALRALAHRSPAKLTKVSVDPVLGWHDGDPATIRGLAALELRSAGIRIRALQ